MVERCTRFEPSSECEKPHDEETGLGRMGGASCQDTHNWTLRALQGTANGVMEVCVCVFFKLEVNAQKFTTCEEVLHDQFDFFLVVLNCFLKCFFSYMYRC